MIGSLVENAIVYIFGLVLISGLIYMAYWMGHDYHFRNGNRPKKAKLLILGVFVCMVIAWAVSQLGKSNECNRIDNLTEQFDRCRETIAPKENHDRNLYFIVSFTLLYGVYVYGVATAKAPAETFRQQAQRRRHALTQNLKRHKPD